MQDARNNVEGYDNDEKPRRYQIREVLTPTPYKTTYQLRGFDIPPYQLGDIVERKTNLAIDPVNHRFYHSLQDEDQLYSDLVATTIQRACGFFYDPEWEPLHGIPDIIMSDDAIRESIHRLNHGENQREADRTGKAYYDLEALPWGQQRALVENLYAIRREFGFEKLDTD